MLHYHEYHVRAGALPARSPDCAYPLRSAARRAATALLAAALGWLAACATAFAAGETLSLDEALRLSLNHPSVAAKRSGLKASESGVAAAKWQRFPNLSAQTSVNQEGNTGSVARVQQPLWSGGRISANIESAEAGVDAANATVVEAEQNILVKTASAYAELARVNSRLEAAADNIAEHERLKELIERRASSQISPASDAILAASRLGQARAEKLQLENLAANARSVLEQAVGRRVAQVVPPPEGPTVLPEADQVVDAALRYAPILRRLAAEEQAAAADIDVQKSALWPQLVARYEHTFGPLGFNVTTRDQVFLALEVQTGGGLSSLSAIRQAEARRLEARYAQASARRDVSELVMTDWNQAKSQRLQAETFEALRLSTREVFDSFVRQYSVGRKSWVDVLNAQRENVQARFALADAQWSGFLSVVKLQIATGELSAQTLIAGAGKSSSAGPGR